MPRTRRPHAVVALILALIPTLVFGAFAPARAETIVFDSGHVDAFHVTADGVSLELDLKEDVTGSGVRHAPESVTLGVAEAAWSEETASVPGIDQATYYLPQTQQSDLLWPGWDTQAVAAAGFGSIDLSFNEVTGPGDVFVFETGGLGGINAVLDDDSLDLTSGSTITQDTPAHRHVNWAFTEPGEYTMEVTASGADGSGAEVKSNTATYTWTVGEGGTSERDAATYASEDSNQAPAREGVDVDKHAAPAKAAEKCAPGIVPVIKDDRSVPAAWTDPAELEFSLGEAAKKDLPEAIGPVPAGEAWMIGATQEPGVPWLGANTQHPSMLDAGLGDVTWELTSFDGPGAMAVYTQGGLGQIVGEEWFTADGGRGNGSHTITQNTHVHPVWLFSAPGTYKVGITQSASKDGKTYSGAGVLTFHVGGDGPGANEGHFDLGGEFNPDGGDCGDASAGSGSGGSGSGGKTGAAAGATSLAETGSTFMTLPYAVLGAGLLVLGAGVVRLAVLAVRTRK